MMYHFLALTLPGPSGSSAYNIGYPTGFGTGAGNFTNIGSLVSSVLQVGIYIGGAVMVFWLGWGVFQYIFAGGSKERLAFARKRIIFALVGFFILIMAYAINQYVEQTIFPPQTNSVRNITAPPPP